MLLSVLVLAVVGVAVSTTLLLLSVSAAQTATNVQESQGAKALANACTEIALQRLVVSASYLGNGLANIGQGSCTYTVAQIDSSRDTVGGTGTVGEMVRKVQVTITIPGLIVTSWQEVADFQ